MDFSRATRMLTEDSDWLVKVLIGGVLGLLSILIIPAFFVGGYTVEVIRRAAAGDDRLPAWDDWGGYLVRGVLAFVIQIVYLLPVLLISCCMAATGILAGSNNSNNGAVGPVVLLLVCLVIPFALIGAFLIPAATVRFATTGEIGEAFNFGRVFGLIGANLGQYIIAIVLAFVLQLVAGILGFGVLTPWFGFIAAVIGSHLYGQVGQTAGGQTSTNLPALP